MIDTWKDKLKELLSSRLLPITVIFTVLFFILLHRLFFMQIIHGQEAAQESKVTTEKTRELASTRGDIYDRNGVLLAHDELSYQVTIEDVGAFSTSAERNSMIYELITLIESNGDEIISEFPIILNSDGEFEFNGSDAALLRFKKEIYSVEASKKLSNEQIAATAADIFEYLRYSDDVKSPKFLIDEKYTTEDALKIMAVRYNLFMNRYQRYLPIQVAVDINEKTIAAIKESAADLPGVEINEATHRVYNYSKYFAHILGYTGKVSEEDLEAMGEKEAAKYTANDQIGKKGLEQEYESYLHGVKGTENVTINGNYRVVEINATKEAQAGNDLHLTLDAKMQKKYYDILEKKIANVLLSNIVNSMSYGSKGTSSDDITIPIYEVYYALIENNLIDVGKLNAKNATNHEKSVYKKYQSKKKQVFKKLEQLMGENSKTSNKAAGETMEEYLDYVYAMLVEQEILMKGEIDTESQVYQEYTEDEISLSKFLQEALANQWINLELLNIGDEFYSTKELYRILYDKIEELLDADSTFAKKIYKTLIFDYELSGRDVCLLLYDQGAIEYDEATIEKLESGALSAYDFIRDKIKKLEITPGQLSLDPCSGSIVVTDVKNGDVLALVSYPSYDNNKFANSVDSDYFSYLNSCKSSPMLNRPLQSKTAPGSTFKVVTAIAALTEGVVKADEKILDRHTYDKVDPQHAPRCWSSSSHGRINVTDAIQVSCNYFFFEMGYRLSLNGKTYNNEQGLKKLQKYAKMFGLGSTSGIELNEYEPQISDEDSVRSSIGQGTNAFTPAEITRYITTVANSGSCYNLTLIDKIEDHEGNVIQKNDATMYNELNEISDSTWDLVQEGMYRVVNGPRSSLKYLFQNLDVTVAGKTGTAQESKLRPNHSLFMSFAPYDNPEICVGVVIPNGYGSANAAEVARNIYASYFGTKKGKTSHLPEADAGSYID